MKTIIHNIEIKAIASWLPTNVLDLCTLAELFGEKEVSSIIRATGIEKVRVADETMTASDMCISAAKHLLVEERVDLSKIDGIVFVSQTPDFIMPSTSTCIQSALGLSKETVCIDIHYGCSGYIYGIFQASNWINSNSCENVLVLSGDTSTKIINPRDRSLRMVFGDCGTATLVTKGKNSFGFSIKSDGSGFNKLIIPAGGFRNRYSRKTKVVKRDSDNNWRSMEDLYMDGMAIFDFAINNVSNDIDGIIDFMDWKKEDVNLYALHQANKFMINSIRKKMKVEPEKVPINSTYYGNTGPATIPLLLSDLLAIKKVDLSKVILSGFGVGLSWGSIACNLNNTKFYQPINKEL